MKNQKQSKLIAYFTIYFSLMKMVSYAASCCGGGSASTLTLPKFSKAMIGFGISGEKYDGYWSESGNYFQDPPGSDLGQYRIILGVAKRISAKIQGSISFPYIWNQNEYTGVKTNTNGLGDTQLNLKYEFFDKIQCVWKVRKLQDLMPAIYLGTNIVIPTGISPYGDVDNSFDITGRGFYRFDGALLIEKTITPWNSGISFAYGVHPERKVNKEYGSFVEPYSKRLGNQFAFSYALGYSHYLESMNSITLTLIYAYINEGKGTINGSMDETSGYKKNTFSLSLAYASQDRESIYRLIWNHTIKENNWGRNFPATDAIQAEVNYVFR